MASFDIRRHPGWLATIGAVTLLSTLGLTGCSNPIQDALEDIVQNQAQGSEERTESVKEESSEGTSDEFITRELPPGFPASIPVPDLPLFNSAHSDIDGAEGWVLQYHGSFDAAIVDQIADKMVEAGLTKNDSGGLGGVITMTMLSNAQHNVTVSLMGTKDDQILQIMVAVNDS